MNQDSALTTLHKDTINIAAKHISAILSLAIQHTAEQTAIVVYDMQCPLSIILMEAYRLCLPTATFIHFETSSPADILAKFAELKPRDLVVLIQSTSFRLEAFRIRIELFNKSLKVIEHPHLARMQGEEIKYYIDALAYDPAYYRDTGYALKKLIDNAKTGIVDSGGAQLVFDSPFEDAKLNIGDYSQMKNIGGQFPIGEVFTESKNLESVNGRIRIFAFGDTTFSVNVPNKPITLIIKNGRVTDTCDSTPEFDIVLENIRADEGQVWLRELGFGLNRAFSQHRTVIDIGTYERMCGVHLSLGAKHSVYKKPLINRTTAWHHVDVFALTNLVYLDDRIVYQDGAWVLPH